MEKRVRFTSGWLPWALLSPQVAIIGVFFFWPAAQAVYYSFLVQDPFGQSSQFVWFQNYSELFHSSHYLDSFRITAIFSLLVAGSGILISLFLATMADRVVRGALGYKTLLIWLGQRIGSVAPEFPNPSQFNFLIFGILLVVMMRFRPEGFIPSRQRAAELSLHGLQEAEAAMGVDIETANIGVAPPGQAELGPDAREAESPSEVEDL